MEKVLLTGKNKGAKITGKLITDQSLDETVEKLRQIWELPFVESKVVEILNQFKNESKIKKKDFDIEELLRKLEPPAPPAESKRSSTPAARSSVGAQPDEPISEPMKLLRTDSIPLFDDIDVATEPVRQEDMSPIKIVEKSEPKKKIILKPLKVVADTSLPPPLPPAPAHEAFIVEELSVDEVPSTTKDIDEVVLEEE